MSIASEITRLQNAKSSLKTAINAKNDAEHQIDDETLDDYATFVGDIPTGTDVSDTTATATDVLSGKDFYLADGTKTTGTIATYTGATTIDTNSTLSTQNKYLTSDLTISVDGAGQFRRHINQTVIEVVTTTTNEKIKINVKRGTGVTAYMNWGDGSTREQISGSFTLREHTYATAGRYVIIFSVTALNNFRPVLNSTYEANSINAILFDSYMFGQSSNSPFTNEVRIFCGDLTTFNPGSLNYCSNIVMLDCTNINSLIEQTTPTTAYFTTRDLKAGLCLNSTIGTLILGSSIVALNNDCFKNTTVKDIIIRDVRTSGKSTLPIILTNQYSLPSTISGYIFLFNNRLSDYQSASYWSAFSSKMKTF